MVTRSVPFRRPGGLRPFFFRTPAPKLVWVPFQKKRSCLGSRAHFRSLRAGCPMQFRDKFHTEETHMSLYENSIRIKGFLGKDAITKSITNGAIFVAFSVATKSSYKDKQSGEWVSQTFWHRITAFGKPAIYANNQQLKKGDYVEITGELRSSEYTSKSGEAKS